MADVGRPTVMTQEVLGKLEEAFLNGASDKEAYFLAGISKDAFYDYCKTTPGYTERIEGLRDMVKYAARQNVSKGIVKNGDQSLSQWYLERKAKEEFSQRTETTPISKISEGEVSAEELELAKQILEHRKQTTRNQSTGTHTEPMGGEVQN